MDTSYITYLWSFPAYGHATVPIASTYWGPSIYAVSYLVSKIFMAMCVYVRSYLKSVSYISI